MLVPPRQTLHSHFHWSVVGFSVKDSRGRQDIMSVAVSGESPALLYFQLLYNMTKYEEILAP